MINLVLYNHCAALTAADDAFALNFATAADADADTMACCY